MEWQFSTAGPCRCDWLERAAAEPCVPLEFDEQHNEFNIVYTFTGGGRGNMSLRYCPFCGGKAPESRRQEMFARLTNTEWSRLSDLTRGLRTVDAMLKALGPPDREFPMGAGTERAAKDGEPPIAENFNVFVYKNLSNTADVRVTERADGTLRFEYRGKYIGPPSPRTQSGAAR